MQHRIRHGGAIEAVDVAVSMQKRRTFRIRRRDEAIPERGVQPDLGEVDELAIAGKLVCAKQIFRERIPFVGVPGTAAGTVFVGGGYARPIEVSLCPGCDAVENLECVRKVRILCSVDKTARELLPPVDTMNARVAVRTDRLLPFGDEGRRICRVAPCRSVRCRAVHIR